MLMKSTLFSKKLFAAAALLFMVVSCFAQNNPPEQLLGTWSKQIETISITLTFKSDFKSEVEFTGDDAIEVYSDYEITGNRITFNDQGGDYAANVPGSYTFIAYEDSLNFTLVNDPVEGRSRMLTGTWSKVTGAEE